MNRLQLISYITETYNSDGEHPWLKYPNFIVFRHKENKKWFAVIMDIPKNKLGLSGSDLLDVLNVKCDPLLVSTLKAEKGFYPAYHMNKDSWITLSLDGSVDDERVKWLLDLSYEATSNIKPKRK